MIRPQNEEEGGPAAVRIEGSFSDVQLAQNMIRAVVAAYHTQEAHQQRA